MKKSLIAVAMLGVLAAAPVAVYAEDNNPTTKDSPKQFVSDSSITAKIKGDFVKDKTVGAMDIHVKTHKGIVTLTGTANSRNEADQAVALAKQVDGVSSVQDDIKVK